MATCNGAPRAGSAFLLRDYPIPGQVSLVTALHVVHGCSAVTLYRSACASKDAGKKLRTIDVSSHVQVRARPAHDLVFFLDVGGLLDASSGAFTWSEDAVATGTPIVVAGWNEKDVCHANSESVDGVATVNNVAPLANQRGSLAADVPLITYPVGNPGTSGSAVALKGSDVVVGVHEARLNDRDDRIALLNGNAGEEISAGFPAWSDVSFSPPPGAQSRAVDLADAHSARYASFFLTPGIFGEFGTFGDRLGGELQFEVPFLGNHVAVRLAGNAARDVLEVETVDPGGRVVASESRGGSSLGLRGGFVVRPVVRNWLRLDVFAGVGRARTWFDPSDKAKTDTLTRTSAVAGEIKLAFPIHALFDSDVAVTLGVRSAYEDAKPTRYRYSVFPGNRTSRVVPGIKA
jgi:hypothetical protein